MPKGLPSSVALNSRTVSAFSLDTSIVEAAGFRFNDGPLRHLSRQLPPWLNIWMPDIVVREISRHRLEFVGRAVQQVTTGVQDLRRYIGEGFQEDTEWIDHARSSAVGIFDDQLKYFLKSHNGVVLEPVYERFGTALFDLYFQGQAPFGPGKDKKHEFPDAASLLMLDFEARERDLYVVAVSKDEGWKAYAERSKRIFCVSTLQELTAMFVSDTPQAKAVGKRLGEAFLKSHSELKPMVKSTIERGLISLPWDIKFPHYFWNQIDAGVIDAQLKSFSVSSDSVGVWITSPNNDSCVAEMPVDVDVVLRVEAISYRYDSRGEKIDLARAEAMIERRIELKLLMEMNGPLESGAPEVMVEKMDLGDSPVDVFLSSEDLGKQLAGEHAYFENGDDMPF